MHFLTQCRFFRSTDADKRAQIDEILNRDLPQALSIIDMSINKLEMNIQKVDQDVRRLDKRTFESYLTNFFGSHYSIGTNR